MASSITATNEALSAAYKLEQVCEGYEVTRSGYQVYMPVTLVGGEMLPFVRPLHPASEAGLEDTAGRKGVGLDIRLEYRRRRTRRLRFADAEPIAHRAARYAVSR
jgi:LDH2 family malate/lactate/ureidoglycolate dehydrogenase